MPKIEKGEFSIFPHRMAQFLPPTQQVVLFWLWKYADNKTGKCFPSIATIALNCCVSKNSVRTALKELEKGGRIKKQTRKGSHSKHNKTNLYTVLLPQNLNYPTSKSEVAASKFEGRTKLTELKPKELKPINTSLSKESDDAVVSLLFKAVSIDELERKITSVLPAKWTMSWKQTLCAAFSGFKTVDEIWNACALVESLESDFDTPPHTKHSINTVDEAMRVHGHTADSIRIEVKECGWKEWTENLRVSYK